MYTAWCCQIYSEEISYITLFLRFFGKIIKNVGRWHGWFFRAQVFLICPISSAFLHHYPTSITVKWRRRRWLMMFSFLWSCCCCCCYLKLSTTISRFTHNRCTHVTHSFVKVTMWGEVLTGLCRIDAWTVFLMCKSHCAVDSVTMNPPELFITLLFMKNISSIWLLLFWHVELGYSLWSYLIFHHWCANG